MTPRWDNPVARHAGRLASRRAWSRAALLLLGAAALGLVLQRFWMELEIYSLLQPRAASRWAGLTLLAETLVALPWAAARGALLWRGLRRDGHLEEYRRSRMSAGAIAAGALAAAVRPALLLVSLSLALSLVVAFAWGGLSPRGAVAAHALLAVQAAAFAALGLWLADRLRYPALALPAAAAVLGAAVTGVWALNPFYRSLGDPAPWIYAALLPNPVTAVGGVLETDVLRFSWIYERVRAADYFFTYPPAWQTAGVYLAAGGALAGLLARGVGREE